MNCASKKREREKKIQQIQTEKPVQPVDRYILLFLLFMVVGLMASCFWWGTTWCDTCCVGVKKIGVDKQTRTLQLIDSLPSSRKKKSNCIFSLILLFIWELIIKVWLDRYFYFVWIALVFRLLYNHQCRLLLLPNDKDKISMFDFSRPNVHYKKRNYQMYIDS